MKVLYVASEALPFIASGGLADVAGSLQETTNATLARVRKAMRINYFDDRAIIKEWDKMLKEAKQ